MLNKPTKPQLIPPTINKTMAIQSIAFIFDLVVLSDDVRRSGICLRSDMGAFIVAITTSLILLRGKALPAAASRHRPAGAPTTPGR
jgi:hypothetical protein